MRGATALGERAKARAGKPPMPPNSLFGDNSLYATQPPVDARWSVLLAAAAASLSG